VIPFALPPKKQRLADGRLIEIMIVFCYGFKSMMIAIIDSFNKSINFVTSKDDDDDVELG
jgi:hypothetical protein